MTKNKELPSLGKRSPEVTRSDGWYWVQKKGWGDTYEDWVPAEWKQEFKSWASTRFSGIHSSFEIIVGEKLTHQNPNTKADMTYKTNEELEEIKCRTMGAALLAKSELDEIQTLLYKAQAIYDSLDNQVKNDLFEYHNETATLGHCLRFGVTATDELMELVADAPANKPR
jgi:hypothetical protein